MNHLLHLLIPFFYEFCQRDCYSKPWQGRAYYDASRNRYLMVLYPFHWLVAFAYWVNCQWSHHRHQESWIDKELYRRSQIKDVHPVRRRPSEPSIESRYAPGDCVWLMVNNRPTLGTVYIVSVKPQSGAMGPLRWFCHVWPAASLFGVLEDRCVQIAESDLHESKLSLLASLE